MWEAYGLENEDMLWASIAFNGGIGGQQQAPCGVVSSSAVCLGFRHSCSLSDKEKAQKARLAARSDASELVKSFSQRFGSIICRDIIGLDFSKPEELRIFRESGISREKCDKFVQFAIEKLYELDKK